MGQAMNELLIWWAGSQVGRLQGESQVRAAVSDLRFGEISRVPEAHRGALAEFRKMSRQSQSRMAREVFGQGVVASPSLMEAADALAEAVRGGIFGATRDVERRTAEAGFTDAREWVEDRLEKYDRARERV